jgi:hypothetical protein
MMEKLRFYEYMKQLADLEQPDDSNAMILEAKVILKDVSEFIQR